MAVSILFLFSSTNKLAALDGQRPDVNAEEKAEMQTNMMAERLSLTEEQKTLIYEINYKYAAEAESIREGGRSRDAMRKFRDMSERKDGELKAVLDENQYRQYMTLKEEMRQKMKERRKSGDGI